MGLRAKLFCMPSGPVQWERAHSSEFLWFRVGEGGGKLVNRYVHLSQPSGSCTMTARHVSYVITCTGSS